MLSIEELLHRQVYPNRETNSSGLTLTHEDANTLLHHYFSDVYKCDQSNGDSGFCCSSVLSVTSNHHLQELLSPRTVICIGCVS